MNLILKFTAAAFATASFVASVATPAAAHTGFESSDPADGTSLSEPVDTITLRFTNDAEPVEPGFEVLDPSSTIREPTEVTATDPTTWVLTFDPPLADGPVGVRWRVKAPDAHPIEGSFSFVVDAPVPATTAPEVSSSAAAPTTTRGELPADGAAAAPTPPASTPAVELEEFLDVDADTPALPGQLAAAARTLVMVGLLGGVGGLVLASLVLADQPPDRRFVLRWTARAATLMAASAAVEAGAQVVDQNAGEWSSVWSLAAVGTTLDSPFGAGVALRVAGGVALAVGARRLAQQVRTPADQLVLVGAGGTHVADPDAHPVRPSSGRLAGLGASALITAHAFDGHTVSAGQRLLTSVVAVVHTASAAVWAGGVVLLAAVLWRRRRSGRSPDAMLLGVRFSVIATASLVAAGGAGAILTLIVLDTPSELWRTDWGRLLLVKTSFVAVAACAGGFNHRVLLPALTSQPDDPAVTRRFRTVVTVEAAALLVVAAITALLVGAASN